MKIKHIFMCVGHVREVATGCVHDAFGLAGGTRCVKQKEQLLGIHGFCWAVI